MKIRNSGWSMIELMIALMIVAILVGIAYPSYSSQITKSRRADGYAVLYAAAQREQQFYTVNNSFTETIGEGGLEISATSQEGYYSLSITATANSYTLTATRASLQTIDTQCGDLTLNHLGLKGNSDAILTADKCW